MTQIEIASLRMDFEGVEFVAALNNGEGKPFSRLTFVMAYTRALGLETLPTTGNPVSIVLLATYASYVLLGLYPLRKVSAVRGGGGPPRRGRALWWTLGWGGEQAKGNALRIYSSVRRPLSLAFVFWSTPAARGGGQEMCWNLGTIGLICACQCAGGCQRR